MLAALWVHDNPVDSEFLRPSSRYCLIRSHDCEGHCDKFIQALLSLFFCFPVLCYMQLKTLRGKSSIQSPPATKVNNFIKPRANALELSTMQALNLFECLLRCCRAGCSNDLNSDSTC